MVKRKICVVTGSRADYGPLYWLLHDLRDDPDFSLQIIDCFLFFGKVFTDNKSWGYKSAF